MSPRQPKSSTDFIRAGTFPLNPFVSDDLDGNPQDALDRIARSLGVEEFTPEQRSLLIESSQRYLMLKKALASPPMLTEAKKQIKALMGRTGSVANALEGMVDLLEALTDCSKDLLHTAEILQRHREDQAPRDDFALDEELATHMRECQRLAAEGKAVPTAPRLPAGLKDTVELFREALHHARHIVNTCKATLETFPNIPKGRVNEYHALRQYIIALNKVFESVSSATNQGENRSRTGLYDFVKQCLAAIDPETSAHYSTMTTDRGLWMQIERSLAISKTK